MKRNYGMVTFIGQPMTLLGEIIKVGDTSPDFTVVANDFNPIHLNDFRGKVKIISTIPSVEGSVCDLQTRKFNRGASEFEGVAFISISCDLPFSLSKYCKAAGITKVVTASDHKDTDFGLKYGFLIEELRILVRGIVIIDQDDIVRYVEIVKDVVSHPNYDLIFEKLAEIAPPMVP